METQNNGTCRKKQYQKVSFDLKLSIIDQIANGQISVNHAANKYNISRSSITYWIKKLSNFEDKSNTMSKNQEIKKLKERIEELEFVKDFQQDIIADFENVTGEHLSKKYLPEALAKEIEKKRKSLTK
jgi:transposase-like protein